MNESMNHEAVYRTAPATPGLLKTMEGQHRIVRYDPMTTLKSIKHPRRGLGSLMEFSLSLAK